MMTVAEHRALAAEHGWRELRSTPTSLEFTRGSDRLVLYLNPWRRRRNPASSTRKPVPDIAANPLV